MAADSALWELSADTEIVDLNVGGEKFTTTLTTLRRYPNSKICQMFNGELIRFPTDIDGCFCIDRDGRLFHHILNFLRDGSAPLGLSRGDRMNLLREAEFLGLQELHKVLGGYQNPRPAAEPFPLVASRVPVLGRCRTDIYPLEKPTVTKVVMDPHSSADDFLIKPLLKFRRYVRLRFGQEYSGGGGWVVTSPRNLPDIDYVLHSACLARSPIEAMNKMSQAGYTPCEYPPRLPPVEEFYTESWEVMMSKESDITIQSPAPGQSYVEGRSDLVSRSRLTHL
ncbi:unnamed protein product [Polarella glacialis]|uniref:BTB domain-containing protein n=1 Tax=Polarella glacialis TaxID=89957 RepID=A0A813FM69_POLGL|nr:unnamed protein product [Polarella glacialis]CAE8683970.1 unnamed protein product [Polarella glacialis]